MGTSVQTAAARAAEENPLLVAVGRWIGANRQKALAIGGVLVIVIVLLAWNTLSARQTEQAAGVRLNAARLAFESKNYPLAASELSQVVENYSGTRAAQEANILLAQSRLLQGQSQQAIELLKRFASRADPAFRAQAYGLLGAAYDNVGHPKEAAEAYQQAADAAQLPFLKAQSLTDAGRAWSRSWREGSPSPSVGPCTLPPRPRYRRPAFRPPPPARTSASATPLVCRRTR